MVDKIKYILEYIKINFKTAMEYRTSFFMQIFGMLLNDIALLFFWFVFFSKVGSVKEWKLNDVITLYAIVATAYGWATGFFGNMLRLPSMIYKGELDFYLTLPKSPLIHILISRMSFSAFGDMLFGILIYLLWIRPNFTNFLLFIFFTLISGLIFLSFSIIISSLTFYLQNIETLFYEIINALLTFSLYPKSIFPTPIQIIFYTLLPTAFMVYIPLDLLKNFSTKIFIILITFTIILTTFSILLFSKGLKKYSSGSIMGPRW